MFSHLVEKRPVHLGVFLVTLHCPHADEHTRPLAANVPAYFVFIGEGNGPRIERHWPGDKDVALHVSDGQGHASPGPHLAGAKAGRVDHASGGNKPSRGANAQQLSPLDLEPRCLHSLGNLNP